MCGAADMGCGPASQATLRGEAHPGAPQSTYVCLALTHNTYLDETLRFRPVPGLLTLARSPTIQWIPIPRPGSQGPHGQLLQRQRPSA